MHNLDQFNDQELVHQIGQGNEEALGIMYRRYNRQLFVYAVKILRDKEEAYDAVHEVFLKMYCKIRANELMINSSLSAFLHQSVRNHILNNIEKTQVREKYFTKLQVKLAQGEASTENYIQEKETRKQIAAGLDSMPSLTREIFELSRRDELTYDEISRKKSINPRTVKRHMKEAIRLLQAKLTAWIF